MRTILFYSLLFFILSCSVQEKTPKVKRFFSEKSFWNQPIPENPEIDPRTDKWIKMLKQEPTKEYFGLNCFSWTLPVYEVDENTPFYQVKHHYLSESEKKQWITVKPREKFGHGPNFNPLPIPSDAKPDPQNDAHYAIIDWKRMLAWDIWSLTKLDDGSWESNTGMMYRLDGDGVFDGYELGYVDGESVHFHGPGRASGVPVIAGLVRYDEVMSGEVRHKLSCATRYAAHKEFTYPASWTDGFVDGGIPEGAVIQLDPNLDLALFNLTKEETIIAKAMQKYGMVVVDVAQGQPIYVEGLWAHPNKSWEGKIRDWDGGINDIPYDHYRVLKIKNPVYKGDGRRKNRAYWSDEPIE